MPDWFHSAATPLTPGEIALAQTYLGGLVTIRPSPVVTGVTSWTEAGALIRSAGGDPRWEQAEFKERQRLLALARAQASEVILYQKIAVVMAENDAVLAAARLAAGRQGCSDDGLVRAAAGAASEAGYLAALARHAGEGTSHPFLCKATLFAMGRWPLVVCGGAFAML